MRRLVGAAGEQVATDYDALDRVLLRQRFDPLCCALDAVQVVGSEVDVTEEKPLSCAGE